MRDRQHNGWAGLILVVGTVLAWDVPALRLGWQTISDWVGDAAEVHPLVTLGTIIMLGLHLTRRPKFLRKYDPLHRLADALRR